MSYGEWRNNAACDSHLIDRNCSLVGVTICGWSPVRVVGAVLWCRGNIWFVVTPCPSGVVIAPGPVHTDVTDPCHCHCSVLLGFSPNKIQSSQTIDLFLSTKCGCFRLCVGVLASLWFCPDLRMIHCGTVGTTHPASVQIEWVIKYVYHGNISFMYAHLFQSHDRYWIILQ